MCPARGAPAGIRLLPSPEWAPRGEKGNAGTSAAAPGKPVQDSGNFCAPRVSRDPNPLPCPRPAPRSAKPDPFPCLSTCSVLGDSELSEAQVAMVTRLSSPQDLLIPDSAHSGVGSGDPRCPCHIGGCGGGHVGTRFPCRLIPHRPKVSRRLGEGSGLPRWWDFRLELAVETSGWTRSC